MNSMTQPSKPASQLGQQSEANPADISAPASPTTMQRVDLRQILLQNRRAIPLKLRAGWDQSIRHQIAAWCETHQPNTLGIYWPIQGEPDLTPLYPSLHQSGIRLSLPVAVGREQPLQYVDWQPDEAMMPDQYQIPTPQRPRPVPVPDVILIPCVGFNADRFRLGYGGGFYDRTLATWPDRIALGVAYQQALSVFTADSHDIAMHHIFTESGDG